MGYEIDYLPVAKNADEKDGDAIAMRFWNESPRESLVVTVDGGTRDSGKAMVEHIREYYPKAAVDIAILTHPDADHASGLRDVLEELPVGLLLTHIPWSHAAEILDVVKAADQRATVESIETRLKDAFPAAVESLELAYQKGVNVLEPFAYPTSFEVHPSTHLHLLGPNKADYLNRWLPNYDCLPVQPQRQASLLEKVFKATEKAVRWVSETWDSELLLDPGPDEVTAENSSGAILAFRQSDKCLLFCGDAGVDALNSAILHGHKTGLRIDGYTFFHVPHHGSRHNVGPTLLNALFGSRRPDENHPKTKMAFVSAHGSDPKHPSRRVTNALNRRGVTIVACEGSCKLHHSNDAPPRSGWSAATPIPFHKTVEATDD